MSDEVRYEPIAWAASKGDAWIGDIDRHKPDMFTVSRRDLRAPVTFHDTFDEALRALTEAAS